MLLVLPLLAGCSSAEGREAQTLLQQAGAAMQNVKSMTFRANLKVDADGRQLGVEVTGGGYSKGPRRGDFFVDMKMSGALGEGALGIPGGFGKLRVAHVRGRAWMEMAGRKIALPAAQLGGGAQRSPDSSALAGFDITRYVTDVRVEGGHSLNGRAMTKIVGVLDTASLLEGFGKLDGGWTARTGQPIPNLDGNVSETRVVLFVDDQTHLLAAALGDVEAKDGDEHVKLHVDFALTSVDRPVALPRA